MSDSNASGKPAGRRSRSFSIFGWIVAAAVVIDVALAAFGYNSLSLQAWLRTSSFNRVHRGMTKNQVEAIVGQPKTIEPNLEYFTWIYDPWTPASGRKDHSGTQANLRVYVDFGVDGRVSQTSPEKSAIKKGQVITHGMTENEVLECAGKPDSVLDLPYAERWTYPHWNGTEHRIDFDTDGKVIWTTESCDNLSRPGTWSRHSRSHD